MAGGCWSNVSAQAARSPCGRRNGHLARHGPQVDPPLAGRGRGGPRRPLQPPPNDTAPHCAPLVQAGQQGLPGLPVGDRGRGHRHGQQESEGVDHDVPLAAVDLLPAIEAPGRGRHRSGCLHRLRVDDAGRRLRIPARDHADPLTQPVVELGGQTLVPPAPEEGVDAVPRGEVHGHRPPGDTARDQVAHRVHHLPVAIALRLAAASLQPAGNRHRVAHDRPLRIAHVGRIPRAPVRPVPGVPEPVSEAITLRGGRVGRHRRRHERLQHQGPPVARLDSTPTSCAGGPALMPGQAEDHPTESATSNSRSPGSIEQRLL